jgi:hypothetical protein
VCIPKTDNTERICEDYEVTINQWLEVDHAGLVDKADRG